MLLQSGLVEIESGRSRSVNLNLSAFLELVVVLARIRKGVDYKLHNSLYADVFLCGEAEYREYLVCKHSGPEA